MTNETAIKEITSNRRAGFEYHILETYEVGIVLTGTEIKSIRNHGASIQEAYISVDSGELWLINAQIIPYSHGNVYNHEEKRKRKLLAHHREIFAIERQVQEKGLTCIALALYFKNGRVKARIGIGKGKKLYDKREDIKSRDDKRTMDRAIKHSK